MEERNFKCRRGDYEVGLIVNLTQNISKKITSVEHNASFVGSKCDKEVSNKPSLSQHVKMIHKTGIQEDFKCKHCADEVEEPVDFYNQRKNHL